MERHLNFVSQEILNYTRSVVSALICRFSIVPNEIPLTSLHMLKTLSELLEPRIAKTVSKRTTLEDTHFPISKLCIKLSSLVQYGRGRIRTLHVSGRN